MPNAALKWNPTRTESPVTTKHDEILTPNGKKLVAALTSMYRAMVDHLKKVQQKTGQRTNLLQTLEAALKSVEHTKDIDQLIGLTSNERIETYVDHFDKFLEHASDMDGIDPEDILGDDHFNGNLVKFGETIDDLRHDVIKEYGRNAEHDFTPNFGKVHATAALSCVKASLEAEGFETLVVALTKRPLAERMRARKKRIKWLKTSAGRQYRRKQKMRIKLHRRKDPKRSRLMRKVAQVYHH